MQPNPNIIGRGEFYRILPDGRYEFYFDSTMIRNFTDCEAKFKLKFIDRIGLKGGGFGAAATIGIWWARCLEGFYNRMKDWQDKKRPIPTRGDIIECAGLAWTELEMEEWGKKDPKRYATFGGIHGSILMAGQYFDGVAGHDLFNWRIVSAELGFGRRKEVFVGENDKVRVYVIGKPDLTVISKAENRLMPVDNKSIYRIKGNVEKNYKPHNQMATYIYATNLMAQELGMDMEVDRCVVSLAARMAPSEKPRDGVKKPRFKRVFSHYNAQEIEEWRQNTIGKAVRLRGCIERNEWPWREQACHLYSGCEYRRIHSVPPGARAAAIQADFVQIEPWVPYDVEEEDEENNY